MSSGLGQTIGREKELGELDALLARLHDGAPACVAIQGEPGIGKTRLLRELRVRGDEQGHLVLTGSVEEFERDVPFGVWVDALDAYVASREIGGGDPLLSSLPAVLPSLRDGSGGRRELIAEERFQAHRAVRRLLELLAADKPVVLILDDLHWADAASVELIGALLRRELDGPVLLALALRSGQGPAKLRAALYSAEATHIELTPLSQGECAELIGDSITGAQLGAIVRESAGNPFYTLQLARAAALPARESGPRSSNGVAGVPAGLADALMVELAAVSDPARALIEAAAIAGDPFDLDLANRIAELSPEAGMQSLDELLETGLLHDTELPRRFAFRHPLVRRAVYESTRAGWRLTAHSRAAALLGVQGVPATARAHHVEQSAATGDAEAVALLLEAAETAKARSPAGAARWYAAALRLMSPADTQARLEVLIALAAAQRAVGANDRCCDTLAEAVELVAPGDNYLRVDLTAQLAASEVFLGRHDQARRRLAAVASQLPEEESPPGVRALVAQTTVALFTSDPERGRELAKRGLAAARAVGDPGLIGEAAASLAHVATVRGDVALGMESQDEASALLEALPDHDLALHLNAMHALSRASLHLELYEDAVRIAERAIGVCASTGRGEATPVLRSTLAQSALMLGRLALAKEAQDAAVEAARLLGNDYVTCGILSTTASIALLQGDLETALRAGEESVDILGPEAEGHVLSVARAGLALTMREAGRSAAEAAQLVEPLGGWTLERLPAVWRVRHLEALVRIELGAGDVAQAAEFARLAELGARGLRLAVTAAIAQRAQAAVALAQGDGQQALELALASEEAGSARGARVEAARSRTLAGRACAAAGDRPQAIELLRAAEAELSDCGALHPRNEARRELRKLGARAEPRGPSPAEETGLGALSSRELEVAELVSRHKTNPEIAKELYLSVKTIESHLRNVFFKLGVSSRRDVARVVERGREQVR